MLFVTEITENVMNFILEIALVYKTAKCFFFISELIEIMIFFLNKKTPIFTVLVKIKMNVGTYVPINFYLKLSFLLLI